MTDATLVAPSPAPAGPSRPAETVEAPKAAPKPKADAEPADGRSAFVVTPRAGPRVAGQRVKDQQHIRLTEHEAASDLLTGAIVRKGEKLHEQLLADARPRPAAGDEPASGGV